MAGSTRRATMTPRFLWGLLVCLCRVHMIASKQVRHHHKDKWSILDDFTKSDRWHRRARPLLASTGFVYVYDLPDTFHKESLGLEPSWHTDQYDYDVMIHEHLLTSPLRTTDPAQALLFYLPLYLSRRFNWFWQRTDREVNNFWQDAWLGAQNYTSGVVLEAIEYVKTTSPYWARRNGADHFTVFSYDHGRCDLAAFLTTSQLGKMFAIQSFGDLAARSDGSPSWKRDMSENYTWDGPRSWSCVRPDTDILVPMYTPYTREELVSPFSHPRPISTLLRFEVKLGDGKHLMEIHGHRLRHELLALWEANGLPGSAVGLKPVKDTEDDMRQSVFCLCPPGNTQDSTRVWRALALGCIPVTFFRATEMPFARFLGLDYRQFMINIQPDDYADTPQRLEAILNDTRQLKVLQHGVLEHQARFLWDNQNPNGVYANLAKELTRRAASLATPQSVFT